MQETKRKTEDAVRINKYLSQAGICSRRQADTYVEEGRVEVDGEVAVSGTKVLPGQSVTFDGKPVKIQEDLIFLAFHKPRGIVCTASKEEKDNIIDYINYPTRIYPIGRLDKDSQGLILLTNDGEAANQIMKARNYHESAAPEKEDTCSMCGNFCAVKNMNKIMEGEIVSIFDE